MPDRGRVWFHDILPMEQALIASALESAGLRAITADELVYDARVGVHVPRDGWDLLWSRHSAFDHDKDLKVRVLILTFSVSKPGATSSTRNSRPVRRRLRGGLRGGLY